MESPYAILCQLTIAIVDLCDNLRDVRRLNAA